MTEYYKVSPITGKRYNLFSVVRILNLYQVRAYLRVGMEVMDIEISEDRETHKPIVVFLFDKEATKEVYDLWCKHELEV